MIGSRHPGWVDEEVRNEEFHLFTKDPHFIFGVSFYVQLFIRCEIKASEEARRNEKEKEEETYHQRKAIQEADT